MNNADLQVLFDSIIETLPLPAKESIVRHRQENGIRFRVEFNDGVLDQLGKRDHCLISVAVNHLTWHNLQWFIGLRSYLSRAPDAIVRTIIQHEVVHCFLKPYFFPNPKRIPAMRIDFAEACPQHFGEIHDIMPDKMKTEASVLDREEQLVRKINLEWGCDDALARVWIEKHMPREFWPS